MEILINFWRNYTKLKLILVSWTSDLLELKWHKSLRPVFNPSITDTTADFSDAFGRDKVFMNTLFKLVVQLQTERLVGQAGSPIWLKFCM